AAYDKVRLPWQMVNGGPGSGIYRTTDGGESWTRLTNGLPSGRIGRIGLDIYPRDPNIVYAVIENDNPVDEHAQPDERGRIDIIGGERYRTADGGESWTKMNADTFDVMPKGPYYFTQVRVYPDAPDRIIVTGEPIMRSDDGGRTWDDRIFRGMFGDFRTLWIDPVNPRGIIARSDGGISIPYDDGRTSVHLANRPGAQVYPIGADLEDPANAYVR